MKHAILTLLLGILPLQASDLWSTNYEESLKKAADENRMVLLEFTGSDWCPPCKKQAEDVFAQPAFEQFASANLVPVKLDFPRRADQSEEQKAANQALAKNISQNVSHIWSYQIPDATAAEKSGQALGEMIVAMMGLAPEKPPTPEPEPVSVVDPITQSIDAFAHMLATSREAQENHIKSMQVILTHMMGGR